MKKILGIILIMIAFCLVMVIKIGPSRETSWLFKYGELIPMLAGAAILIPGLVLYNKNR
ncbi:MULTISPECIES: DUF6903 family protein [unclassified Chryseobacterium]|uniref:DUF6903 family protein n=1 Tax=unclassified Chryseobacterium TaxID=2593645 RepID=UPI0013B3FD48|nr:MULTISPECIES: hypothetical protein [unclassified Chryseobacterium]MDQ1858532.1 hypothetical protein [Chryseobacterium sp. WLY505]